MALDNRPELFAKFRCGLWKGVGFGQRFFAVCLVPQCAHRPKSARLKSLSAPRALTARDGSPMCGSEVN